jgi:hypothetical protein
MTLRLSSSRLSQFVLLTSISALQTADSLVSALHCVQPKQDGRNPSTAGGFHVRYLTIEAGLTLSLWNSNYSYRKGLLTAAFHSAFIQYFAFNIQWELSSNNTCHNPLCNALHDIVLVRVYAATSLCSVGYVKLPVITTIKWTVLLWRY